MAPFPLPNVGPQLLLVSTICRGSLASVGAGLGLRPSAGAGSGAATGCGAALLVSIMTSPACSSDPEISTSVAAGTAGMMMGSVTGDGAGNDVAGDWSALTMSGIGDAIGAESPFRAWFEFPYNHYDAQNQRYYYGGTWAAVPHQSITNISAPLPQLAHLAEPQPAPVTRSGFGSTAHRHSIWA